MIISTNTKYQPTFTNVGLMKEITEHIEDLAKETDAARLSTEMIRYLDMCARFHHYSPCNIWMIVLHNPDATYVAGYKKWSDMNRFVLKGEKGIPILAPIIGKKDTQDPDSDKVLKGFKVAFVFDISQTDGEPLPEPPDWKSPEKNKELEQKLIEFAKSKGIQVSIVKQAGEIQGVSKGGYIEIDPSAGTTTLIHEISHELMHRDKDRPRDSSIRELEAESVSFVVSKHIGLETTSSPNYIALHGANSEMIFEHLERIRRISILIINEIQSK